MPSSAELLATAREAYARHDWPEAYRALVAARDRDELGADDLEVLSDAAWWLGLVKETTSIAEASYQHFLKEGRVNRAAMNALTIGFGWFLRGELTIGSGWLSRARRLLEDRPPSVEHGFLRWIDASELIEAGHLDAAVGIAHEVRDLAEQFASPDLAALALVCEGTAVVRGGDVVQGLRLLDEAMLPVLAGQVGPDWAGNIYCSMMGLCHDLADVRRAREWTDATERWCEGLPSAVMFAGICRIHRIQLLQLEGEWARAEHEATIACTELAEMNVAVVAEAHYQLGELHRMRDDLSSAEAAYQRARTLGRDPQPGLALLRLAQERTDDAVAIIRLALEDSQVDPFRRARLLVAAVEITLENDDVDGASRLATELHDLAERYQSPGFATWALHAAGAVLLAQDRPERAAVVLTDALHRYVGMSARCDAATTRLLVGRAHAAAGDQAAAAIAVDAAVAELQELGASMHLRRLADARDAGDPPAGLTVREAQVLACVASGASNKQAAETLFISEKTVARHLSNIYAKLGVSSRTAAAAWSRENRIDRFVPPA